MPITYDYGLFHGGESEAPAPAPALSPEEPSTPAAKPAAPTLVPTWTSQLRGLKSLIDTAIEYPDAKPWEWDRTYPGDTHGFGKDKLAWRRWSRSTDCDWLFYTGMEGLNPRARVSKDNPVERIHAIVAEYDGTVTDENVDLLTTKLPPDLLPTFFSRSRFSGGGRLTWILDNPLPVGAGNLASEFLKLAAKELKMKLLLAGFDDESLAPKQTFEVGTDWRRIGNPLHDSTAHAWLFRAASRAKLTDEESIAKIPMDEVQKEVERQFPLRWSGPFEPGARGVVFFDPTSVNPTAAILTDEGVVCFGQPKPFYSWKEILGSDFVRKFEEDVLFRATAGVYYDGSCVWRKPFAEAKTWDSFPAGDLTLLLTEGMKLSQEAAKRAAYQVKFANRVTAALPFVGDRRELVLQDGKRFLNTFMLTVMEPAPGAAGKWGEGFPWLKNFFETRPCPTHDPERKGLWHLLAWFQHFYRGMRDGTLAPGQVVAICGGPSVGKTLFLDKILTPAVGGSVDAAAYLQGNTSFNSQLFDSPLWVIDDGSFTADERSRKRCSELLKKVAATSHFEYHRKGAPAAKVHWKGRAVLLLNTDPDSIIAVPTLGISNVDKVNVYRWREVNETPFEARSVVEDAIARELPFFLRWLLEADFSEHVTADPRYGTMSYADAHTATEAENASGAGALMECLSEHARRSGTSGLSFVSTTQLMVALGSDEGLRSVVGKWNGGMVGRWLRSLASRKETAVTRSGIGWVINWDKLARITAPPEGFESAAGGKSVDLT